jgi:lipoprotein-anchoring transpeptidase ErfK/SrfK/peptidoglycan hydrolase-like protein with peptidoglycan-binding domain
LRNEGSATSGRATNVAKWASTTFLTWLGVGALAVAIAAAPADAKKRKPNEGKPEEGIADIDTSQPMVLVVSLRQQKLDVYRGTTLVTSSSVSTGMPGHATKAGVFSILEKQRFHHSNIYSGAPMPWMNRITWSGTAFHAGVVPGYPASHGCIRLPFSFAPKLFKITTVGDNVVVARDRPVPQLVEHPALFQPLPPPPAPALVNQQPPQRQSMNEVLPLPAPHKPHPGVLARADISGSTTDVPTAIGVEATQSVVPSLGVDQPAPVEDTHSHAFDPFVGQPANQAASANGHALDDEEDGTPAKPSVASTAPAKAAEQTPAPIPVKAAAPFAAMPMQAAAPAVKAPVPAALSIPVKVEPAPAKVEAAPVKAEPEVTAKVTPLQAPVATPAPNAPLPAPVATATPAAATPAPEATPAPVSAPAAPVVATVTPAAPIVPAVQAVATTPSIAIASVEADAIPSISASKLGAGTKAAAIQAAEPRSTAPLRILVTRRTNSDRIIGVQQILASMGYLEAQNFDGTLGKATAGAIKAFQRNNGMAETGTFNEELVKKVYEIAGKGEPPVGHLFVRQEFGRMFDAPVTFKDPETPLGTHIFTALKFAPGDTKTQWMTISVQGDDGTAVLDRIEIPADLRQKISERLTPGSSLIVGDTAINTAGLTKGSDFLVWAKDTPAKITSASLENVVSQPKPRKKKRTTVRRNGYDYSYRSQRAPTFRGYPSWPW